jgi:hypothetical protein
MVTLRARFDGRVFVPEGPVDLPPGKVLELRVEEVEGAEGTVEVVERNGLPVFRVPGGGRTITSEDVASGEDEP